MDNQLAIFEENPIRRMEHNGGIYFSVTDVIRILSESTNPKSII